MIRVSPNAELENYKFTKNCFLKYCNTYWTTLVESKALELLPLEQHWKCVYIFTAFFWIILVSEIYIFLYLLIFYFI